MKEISVPVPASITGHLYDAFHSEGLIWALNCVPLGREGLRLWRPQVHPNLECEVFNPETDKFLDSCCAQNRIHVLRNDGNLGKAKIKWWDGTECQELAWDYPPADRGQITLFGSGMVLALEGWGQFFVEWDEGTQDWVDTYRLGALLWSSGQSAHVLTVNTSSSQDLVQVNWSSPELSGFKTWVSRVVLYAGLPDQDNIPDFEWTLEIEDGDGTVHRALEVYRRDSVAPAYPGVPYLWTPITFTFLKAMKPPLTVRIIALNGTTINMLLEGASATYLGAHVSHSWTALAVHMSVGGTMCPDKGVVGAYRGSLFGVYKGNFLQVASAVDLEFQDEVSLETWVERILGSWDGVYVFGQSKTYLVLGWTAKGVELRQVSPKGIPDHFTCAEFSHGVYSYFYGSLYRFSSGRGERIDLPFYGGANKRVYLSGVDLKDFVILAMEGESIVLVFDLQTGGFVFWKFDEINADPIPYPLQGCKGALIFSDGKVRLLTLWQFEQSYTVEAVIATPLFPEQRKFEAQLLELSGAVYNSTGQAEFEVLSFGEDTVHKITQTFPSNPELDSLSSSVSWISSVGNLPAEWIVPQDGIVVLTTAFPLHYQTIDAVDSSDTLQTSITSFLTGKKFLVGVRIPKTQLKSHANSLTKVRLLGEPIGSDVVGRI